MARPTTNRKRSDNLPLPTTATTTTTIATTSVCLSASSLPLLLLLLVLIGPANSGEVTCYGYESSFYLSYTIEPEGECLAWVASANTLISACSEDGANGTLTCDRVAAASEGHAMIKTDLGSAGLVHVSFTASFLPSLGEAVCTAPYFS